MTTHILALPGNETLADALSDRLDASLAQYDLRNFPDGETYVRIDTPVAECSVVFLCTLHRPDDKLVPLTFLAGAARELGASRIGLVSPYLAYMRQDRQFQKGEGITSAYFAELLSGWFDWIVTVDPHLHRRSSLSEIYTIPAKALHAAPLVSNWIRENVEQPVLIGPDAESIQWVRAVADDAAAPYLVLEKIRYGDREVEVSVPDVARWRQHTPVLVDDIISTARTMIETVSHLRSNDLRPPICVGVHGVFAGGAHAALLAAGAANIVTCNTIPHATNAIDVSGLLAEAIGSCGVL